MQYGNNSLFLYHFCPLFISTALICHHHRLKPFITSLLKNVFACFAPDQQTNCKPQVSHFPTTIPAVCHISYGLGDVFTPLLSIYSSDASTKHGLNVFPWCLSPRGTTTPGALCHEHTTTTARAGDLPWCSWLQVTTPPGFDCRPPQPGSAAPSAGARRLPGSASPGRTAGASCSGGQSK